ncbi:hypothetical protein BGZ73_007209 [Actinomortierella ambigua]|nr:hypothetical protein BGZ73_007209 [Actinomortierella ambigua]
MSHANNVRRTATVGTWRRGRRRYQAWMLFCLMALTQLVLSTALPTPENNPSPFDGPTSDDNTDPARFGSNSNINSSIVTDVGQKTMVSTKHVVLGILLMLAGLIQVFYGFKFIRLTLLVGGFMTSALIASTVMIAIRWDLLFETFNPKMYYFWVWFLCGLIGAILSFRFFDLGIAMAGALGGFAVAMIIIAAANTTLSEAVRYVIIGVFVIFFSGIATFYERFFIIAGTSLAGSMLFMFGVDEFVQIGFREMLVIFNFVGKTLNYSPTSKVYIMIGCVPVLALLGTAWEFWHHQTPVLVDRRALFRLYGRPFGKRPKRMVGQKIKHRYRDVGWKGLLRDIKFMRKRSAESVLYGSEPDESWCYVDEQGNPIEPDENQQQQQQQQQQQSTVVTEVDPSNSASHVGEDNHPGKEIGGSSNSSGIDTRVEVGDETAEIHAPEGKAEWEPAQISHSVTVSSDSGNVQVVEVYETFPISVIEETTTTVVEESSVQHSQQQQQQQTEDHEIQDAQEHRPPLAVIQHHQQSSETHTSSSSSVVHSTSTVTHTSSSQVLSSSSPMHTSSLQHQQQQQQVQTYTSSSSESHTSSAMHSSSQTHVSSSDMHSSSSAAYVASHTSSAHAGMEDSARSTQTTMTTKATKTTTRTTTTTLNSSSRDMTEISSTVRSISPIMVGSGGVGGDSTGTTTITTTTTTLRAIDGDSRASPEADEPSEATKDIPRLSPDDHL